MSTICFIITVMLLLPFAKTAKLKRVKFLLLSDICLRWNFASTLCVMRRNVDESGEFDTWLGRAVLCCLRHLRLNIWREELGAERERRWHKAVSTHVRLNVQYCASATFNNLVNTHAPPTVYFAREISDLHECIWILFFLLDYYERVGQLAFPACRL